MKTATLALALLGLAAPQGAPARDRVILKKGNPVDGTVSKDTWREVMVGTQTFKPEDVLRVEYGDAPAAFRGAMENVAAEKWQDALTTLQSAEDYANSKEKGVVKPRNWFPAYLAYYRGYCMLQQAKYDQALIQFEKIRKEFKESRFLPEAYELALQAYREKKDEKGLDAFEKELDAAPPELRAGLKAQSALQRAELFYDAGKFAEAQRLFESTASSPDPDVAALSTIGVIRSLSGKKDAAGVEGYCRKVLSTAAQPALLLVASNALGDAQFDKKQYALARGHYIDSVIKHNPGRTGTSIDREHERALYQLARCYEELIGTAKDPEAKGAFAVMASSAFRELSIEYPSGRYREEAVAKADKLQAKEEKKK